MRYLAADTQVDEARVLAAAVLADLPDRWSHTMAVAGRARAIRRTVKPADGSTLVAAAWLHDVGYAAEAQDCGFHPLDGARLVERQGWPPRIAALVAHHSGALFVARASGLGDALSVYPDEGSLVTDALLYADQTTGPRGETLPVAQRIEESLRRHGPDSANARVSIDRTAFLLAAVARVEMRLAGSAGS
jgi:putative nucleotidyltransferase with HDIG domain